MRACVSKVSKLAKALKFVLFTASMAQYHKADSLIDRRSKYLCHILGAIQVLRNARGGGCMPKRYEKRYEGVGGGYVSVT